MQKQGVFTYLGGSLVAVMRINKNKNYTTISNYHLREKNMSLKAKGLLTLMLSLPEEWDYSISGLVAICKENITAIRSALKELEEFGYLKIIKTKNDKGQFEYIYDIFEFAEHEKPHIENLYMGNKPQLNTNNKNTNNKKENTLSIERVKESERETHSHTPKKEKKKSEKKAEKKPKTKPEKKQIYGEFKNVFLSDTEIAILKTEYPGEYLEKIERLSKYIEKKGVKYKNHFVVIRDWLREDTKPNTQNSYDLDAYEGETDFLSDLNAKYKQDEESLDYLKSL